MCLNCYYILTLLIKRKNSILMKLNLDGYRIELEVNEEIRKL